ncbi:hypothetical protein yc1106_05256 [Curvularia clavata]|uniref:Xylanolytic transcriptional activator regulatory domain-containing protein n=1 Tax=Curvularia clavata TaxID=95742 RepID=A0A9Q8Z7S4_CURCL|nr:hypothetical protein yc1106_05256 [Curvularia clavata]
MADNEVRRNPRLRLASECLDGDSVRLRGGHYDRSYAHQRTSINKLRRRVAWLESIVRERLPDIDLSTSTSREESEGLVREHDTASSPVQASPHELRENLITDLAPAQPAISPDQRAHEIGMISVGFNTDQKYIGPSSGYFLARLLLANTRKYGDVEDRISRSTTIPQLSIDELVSAAHGPLPLPPYHIAVQLCQIYYETIHPQYPILHELSFRATLEQVYEDAGTEGATTRDDPASHFHVYMVLAISAAISTWRTKRQIPGESYCLSALQYFDQIRIESSLRGLQSMLLLLIFTMYSPHMQLNVWNLHYQCLAAAIDLGLQRQVTTSSGISLLEQELRTRIFWTVFTIDRTIASMMGRPIGLRDEACELRLLSDAELVHGANDIDNQRHNIAVSIHLFKLAKLNSEIKYVANSIARDVPTYAYPSIRDISAWQSAMLQQMDDWVAAIPQTQSPHGYIKLTCELRFLSVKMLLLRPSPAIPNPTSTVLAACHEAARHSLQLYEKLYKNDLLIYDWLTLHGVVFSTVTAVYCMRAVPEIAREVEPEDFMADISVSLSILSATGEHWSGAKRARDILDDVGKSTIRWLRRSRRTSTQRPNLGQEGLSSQLSQVNVVSNTHLEQPMAREEDGCNASDVVPNPDFFSGIQLDLGLFPETQQLEESYGDATNIDDMLKNLFNDFIPSGTNYH